MRFDTLTRMADNVMIYKYIVKNVARQNGLTATFMPKPLFGDNGSGMHVHQSLWKGEHERLLRRRRLRRSFPTRPSITSAACSSTPRPCWPWPRPTTNSYRRLVPGFEAPVNLAYSQRNRSAICRIPVYSKSPKAKRIEFRAPDPSCNPYLCFAALLMAGLDGIQNRIDPGEPMDKDLYEPAARGSQADQAGARLAGRGAGRAGGRPRVPAQGRRLHHRPARGLHRLQARDRGRSRCACARIRTSSPCTTTPDRSPSLLVPCGRDGGSPHGRPYLDERRRILRSFLINDRNHSANRTPIGYWTSRIVIAKLRVSQSKEKSL